MGGGDYVCLCGERHHPQVKPASDQRNSRNACSGGANVWNNRADGFGFVTSTRECGPVNRGYAPGVSAMRTYSIVTSCGLLAAVMSSAAQAAVVEFTFNLNAYIWPVGGGPGPLVGIAAKINSGSASIQSITGATTTSGIANPLQPYGLPSGWSQQTLASSFTAGGSTANSSQYGFVRGGGGSTYSTANGHNTNLDTGGTGIGYTVTCLLDDGYTPANGNTINLITTMFKSSLGASNGTFAQTSSTFTFDGTNWNRVGNSTSPSVWVTEVSGSFDQFSAAVVPAPGALALLGVAGLAGGRRRRA